MQVHLNGYRPGDPRVEARIRRWRSGLRASPSDVRIEDSGVTVTVRDTRAGEVSAIRARYVVGCDGARSDIRTAIGRELVGEVTNESWGVMDVLAVTDFPDIRLKSAISSAHGNLLIIPREGGYLTRFYVELDKSTSTSGASPRSG